MMPHPPAALRRLWPAFALLMLCLAGVLVAAAPGPPPSAVVAWARAAEWGSFGHDVELVVLDTTAADVPALGQLLAHGTEPQQIAARYALGYSGLSSDAAIRALDANARGDRMRRRGMLIAALGQRGSPADRAWLIRILEEEPLGSNWSAIMEAALALCVLRAVEAVPALERVAAAGDSSGARYAREALRWIREGPWNVEALPAMTDEDQMIRAALRAGLPGATGTSMFNDETRGGVWILDGNAWRFRAGGRVADAVQLGFQSRQNAARTRAILSVSVTCGMLCGSGYDYVLTREGGGWKVTGLLHTWVS
jgi:hypothetical protein